METLTSSKGASGKMTDPPISLLTQEGREDHGQ